MKAPPAGLTQYAHLSSRDQNALDLLLRDRQTCRRGLNIRTGPCKTEYPGGSAIWISRRPGCRDQSTKLQPAANIGIGAALNVASRAHGTFRRAPLSHGLFRRRFRVPGCFQPNRSSRSSARQPAPISGREDPKDISVARYRKAVRAVPEDDWPPPSAVAGATIWSRRKNYYAGSPVGAIGVDNCHRPQQARKRSNIHPRGSGDLRRPHQSGLTGGLTLCQRPSATAEPARTSQQRRAKEDP